MSRATWIRIAAVAALVVLVILLVRLRGAAGQGLTPDLAGDPAAGRRLVDTWCVDCHAIGSQAARMRSAAPNLVDVAKRPRTTALSLNVFLRSSHDTMPNVVLTRGDADDIVAYILSLKRE